MKKGHSLACRLAHYGACLLLVHLAIGCSSSTPQEGGSQAEGNSPVAASPAATAPAEDGKLVVAFGDSLFAGYNLPQDEGFAPELERALNASGVRARVVNAGVSGETTAAGRQRLAFTLDGLDRKPDLVIVGLGANDMLRGLDAKAARTNLDAILADLKRRDVPAILTGMVAAPNMGTDYAAEFNSIYPDLAKKYDVPLDPFFLDGVIGRRALLLPDGIHPNERGIDSIVGRVAPLVADTLKGQG